jgi:hypothetical protein
MSLFGAVWTLGSIKYLAERGVESVTYYETTGWRGLLETDAGSPLPVKFPSLSGSVFPVYHVLADLGDDSLAVRSGSRTRLLVANMTDSVQSVRLPLANRTAEVKLLDETTAMQAIQFPENFRQERGDVLRFDQDTVLELLPYAIARIDSK